MEIHVRDNRLRKALQDPAIAQRRYGTPMAKKLSLRLDGLRAAESLADFWPPKQGPERCHELKGDLAGTFSVDLNHPYRLLFKPLESDHPEVPSDQKERWKTITSIEILKIQDTHG